MPDNPPGKPELSSEPPHRDLRDPMALRALAHPLRLRLLEELTQRGPATATALAERIGETQANCSWHLRHLAKFRFIEEVKGAKGRQRPWRLVNETTSYGDFGEDEPELARAAEATTEAFAAQGLDALRAWHISLRTDSEQWRNAAMEFVNWTWLTPDELAAMKAEVEEVVFRRLGRIGDRFVHPERRPPGSRPVRVVAWAIPAPQDTEIPQREGEDAATEDSESDENL